MPGYNCLHIAVTFYNYFAFGFWSLAASIFALKILFTHTPGEARGGFRVPGSNSFCDCYFFLVRNMPLNFLTFLQLLLWSSKKKNRALYLSWFNRGGPMKFRNTFFQIAKLRFSTIFENLIGIPERQELFAYDVARNCLRFVTYIQTYTVTKRLIEWGCPR